MRNRPARVRSDPRPGSGRALAVGLAMALAVGSLVVFGGLALPAPPAAAASQAFDLYGTFAGGWSLTPGTETNPGPMIVAIVGDSVTIHMFSEDAADHAVFIDFNDNGMIDFLSDAFSTTGLDVTFTFEVPEAPGTHYYYCSIHSPNANGQYLPGAPMYGEFLVKQAPSATFAAPLSGSSWTGGSPHDIVFNLADEDPPTDLTVWVNYSYAGGTQGGTIAGPTPGTANPNVVPWTPSGFSATDTRIVVTAHDTDGAVGTGQSVPFEVDSTPPTVSARSPAPDATNVARDGKILITWSEGMNESVSGAPDAFALRRIPDPAWVPGTVTWSQSGTLMTFTPTATMDATTMYEVHVNGTARDDSSPGNPATPPPPWSFTTGAQLDSTPPTISSVTATPSAQVAGGSVTIGAVVSDETQIGSVSVQVTGPSTDVNLTMIDSGSSTWTAQRTYASVGTYTFTVWVLDGSGNTASRGGSFVITASPPPPAPTGVAAQSAGDGTIRITWSPATGTSIAGYHVYRGDSASGPFTRLTTTPIAPTGALAYVDEDVQPGVTYYYVVTSIDSVGTESPFSSVAAASALAGSGAADYTLWIAGAGIVAVAAVGAFLVWRRKKG